MCVKSKGSVLIEALVLVTIVTFFIPLYFGISIDSIEKSKIYKFKEDIMTLNEIEENLIDELTKVIESDEAISSTIIEHNSLRDIDYSYYNQKNKDYWIEIKNGNIYLIHQSYQLKRYRELNFRIYEEGDNKRIIFIPMMYRSDYIK